jgi:hypothetical protein
MQTEDKADSAIYSAFEDHVNKDPALGERNLMRAILRTAFEDLTKRGEAYRLARMFLISEDTTYVYSFRSICNSLNLCPVTIRARLGLHKSSDHDRMAA